MRCFSAQRNLKKLFANRKYDADDDEFEIFNALKVLSISVVVLGNTYYYTMSGPLRNLDIISEWMGSFSFLYVVWADLQVDVFYWITGFILSFSILKKLQQNQGVLWASPVRILFERYMRLLPLYLFMIFFLWFFIVLFGGTGPRFYQFEQGHGCAKTWALHVFMINNIAPWGSRDYCIEPSWYLANDIWFMIPCLLLSIQYLRTRKFFYIGVSLIAMTALIIQMIQIS